MLQFQFGVVVRSSFEQQTSLLSIRWVVNGLLMLHVPTVLLGVAWSLRPISRCAAAQREEACFFSWVWRVTHKDKIRALPPSSVSTQQFLRLGVVDVRIWRCWTPCLDVEIVVRQKNGNACLWFSPSKPRLVPAMRWSVGAAWVMHMVCGISAHRTSFGVHPV